jgi:aryl-alcohol dehydrogenase-like predicted oxidoreductase
MDYVNFGTAGVKVSRLALGFGFRGQNDAAAATRTVLKALDLGVNLLDCANVYGLMDDRANAGRSEEILGRAVKGRRDDVVITSKVFSPVGAGVNDRGASRFHILREAEKSLKRLDTDRIDVYLLHGFDSSTPLEEQFRALDSLVQSGKVRYIGICNYQAWQVCKAMTVQSRINAAPLITVQNPYSLLNRHLESEMFPMVRSEGVGVMAYSPLAVGLLSGAYTPDKMPAEHTLWGGQRRQVFKSYLSGRAAEVLEACREVAADHGATVAQVALAWVLSHPEVTCAISGADTAEQLADVAPGAGLKLDEEELARLNEVSSGLSMTLDGVVPRPQRDAPGRGRGPAKRASR